MPHLEESISCLFFVSRLLTNNHQHGLLLHWHTGEQKEESHLPLLGCSVDRKDLEGVFLPLRKGKWELGLLAFPSRSYHRFHSLEGSSARFVWLLQSKKQMPPTHTSQSKSMLVTSLTGSSGLFSALCNGNMANPPNDEHSVT